MYDENPKRYIDLVEKNNPFLVQLFNFVFIILLLIPFFILHIYFIIFILLISIPFKFIPLKYLLGLLYANIFC